MFPTEESRYVSGRCLQLWLPGIECRHYVVNVLRIPGVYLLDFYKHSVLAGTRDRM